VGPELWRALVERPLGELVEASVADDALRGTLLTDGLIGTFASAHPEDRRQNRCFLYHVVGNGTGEWRVPVGRMGYVAAELAWVAAGPARRSAGASARPTRASCSAARVPSGVAL